MIHNLSNSQRVLNEKIKCGKDPVYFIKNYCRISHPKKGQIPFTLYPFQEKCLEDFRNHRFNIILKSRQMGLSTLVSAYSAWMCLFHKSKEVVIVATTQRVSQKIIRKIKLILKNVPEWMWMTKIISETKTQIEFDNGSIMTAVPSSPDSARSESLSLLICDEAAAIKDFSEIYTSAYSTLSTGGDFIILSTPKGVSNLYYTLYSQAESGNNDFNPIKLKWNLHPERINNDWFTRETKNMRPHEIAQELECNFLASSNTLLDPFDIDYISQTTIKPARKSGPGGATWIWKDPIPKRRYLISVDVARGDREDYTAFHIIDRQENEVVAEFQQKISTEKFSYYLDQIGREYNNALIVCENNIYGHAVLKDLQRLKYPNVYHPKNKYALMSDYNPINDDKQDYGLNTNGHNRDDILMKLRRQIEKRNLKVYSSRLHNEFLSFCWNGSKYTAQGGANDDLIMSIAIGASILYEADSSKLGDANDINLMLAGISVDTITIDDIPNTGNDITSRPPYMPVQMDGGTVKQIKNIQRHPGYLDINWLLR